MRLSVLFGVLTIGVAVGWSALRGRRDRAPGMTTWMLVGAGCSWSFAFLLLNWAVPALALLGVIVVGGVASGVRVEVLELRDRRGLRDSAMATGTSAREARRNYRRAPRSPFTVIAIWYAVALAWALGVVAVVVVLKLPSSVVESPSWMLPSSSGGYNAPWWMLILMGLSVCGVGHMMVNTLRRQWR